MLEADTRKQLDAAVGNVESALKALSDRLDDALPGASRRRISRAKRAIRHTADSVADRVANDVPSIVGDTRRTIRNYPVRTALTVAVAGYCVWSLIRLANGRGEAAGDRGSFSESDRHGPEGGGLRH